MSGITRTPGRRSVRHRRRSNVTATALTAQPLTTDAITFRDVVETESNEVAGKEVVYTPLEWDPLTPEFSDFNTYPNDGSELSYVAMSLHAVRMIGCRRESELMKYFMEGGTIKTFLILGH